MGKSISVRALREAGFGRFEGECDAAGFGRLEGERVKLYMSDCDFHVLRSEPTVVDSSFLYLKSFRHTHEAH